MPVAAPEIVLEQLRESAGRRGAARTGATARETWSSSAARCATCCSGVCRASWTLSVARRLGGLRASRAVVVARDSRARSASRGRRTIHERFGTASSSGSAVGSTSPTRRAESYPAPGALPEVRAGTAEEDLARRDFTVNAIACSAWRRAPGRGARGRPARWRTCAPGGCACCTSASFSDDPTRLLRLARYAARLGFEIEPHTAELAPARRLAGARWARSPARASAPSCGSR